VMLIWICKNDLIPFKTVKFNCDIRSVNECSFEYTNYEIQLKLIEYYL
jgi:hypothetical protein